MSNQPAGVFFQTVGQAVRRYARHLAIAASALSASVCLAAAGDLDLSFGSKGLFYFPDRIAARNDGYFQTENTRQVIALSRGGYLALGGLATGSMGHSPFVASPSFVLTSSGVLDAAFGQAGFLQGPSVKDQYGFDVGYSYVRGRELADGRLVLASEVWNKCGNPADCATFFSGLAYNVQQNLPNGSSDSSYGVAGSNFVDSHQGNVAILSDGTSISLGITWYLLPSTGIFQYYGATADAVVVDTKGRSDPALAAQFRSQMIRCNPSGTADMSQQARPGVDVTPADQVIYSHGSCVLRLNRDGTPDATFGTGGLVQLDNDGLALTRVLVRKDGGILAFSLLADGSSYRVMKRLANGTPDSSFGAAGNVAKLSLPFAPLGLLGLDGQDRLLVAGYVADSGPNKQTNYIARFDAQLQLDKTFGSLGDGLAPVGNADLGLFSPNSAAVDSSNRIVLAGYFRVPKSTSSGYAYSAYSPAVIRMLADPPPPVPVEPSAGGSGGCGTVRDARFDPTLWALLVTALLAATLRRRRRALAGV